MLLLVVLASVRGSFRAVCLPQETGDLHTLAATLLNVGKIIFSRKIGKVKNNKGKPPGRETHGALVRREWYKSKLARLSPNSIFLAATPTCIFEFTSW